VHFLFIFISNLLPLDSSSFPTTITTQRPTTATPPPSGKYPGPTRLSAPSSRRVHTIPESLSGKRLPPPVTTTTVLGDWEEGWGKEQPEQVGRGSGRRLRRLGRIARVVSRWSRFWSFAGMCAWLRSTCTGHFQENNKKMTLTIPERKQKGLFREIEIRAEISGYAVREQTRADKRDA
jgi:hypothetical protein